MITDDECNTVYLSEILKTDPRFSKTCNEIVKLLKSYKQKVIFLPHTKDIWARDYMPIQVSKNKFIEYRYDPDYLQGKQKGRRDLKSYPDIICEAIGLKTIKSDLILDGGNLVKSSNCIILTDKIVAENKHSYSKTELIELLKKIFEVEKVILIPWDKEEEYGHADGMFRFINEDTVLINQVYKNDKILLQVLKQNEIRWEFLELNVSKPDIRNWVYINFLQTKDIIILPELGIEEDELALEQFKKHYPSYANNNRIAMVDMTNIVKLGGALNCISWTVKS